MRDERESLWENLSQNTIQLAAGCDRIRPKQYPKGLYGCQLCAIYIFERYGRVAKVCMRNRG